MGRTHPGETRRKVWAYVRDRLCEGSPPTVREVQQAFGFRSVQTAREHLEALVSEKKLAKESGVARGYRLPEEFPQGTFVPILGEVPAGDLAQAVENPEGHVFYESRSPNRYFALKVRGDSMRDAGILSGDVVIVRRQPRAEDGEIVVALVGDEATVKRLKFCRNRIELCPENPAFRAIVPDPEEVRILGKVVEIRRSFK